MKSMPYFVVMTSKPSGMRSAAGIFDVVLIAIPSLRIVIASPQPILTSSLCSGKFRSWRLNSERKKGPWLVGNQTFRTGEGTSLGSTIAS
jgi:hypothetical protein